MDPFSSLRLFSNPKVGAKSLACCAGLSAMALILGIRRFSFSQRKSKTNKVFTVVLTGGPCCGKSTFSELLKKDLSAIGYAVYIAPDVATILQSGGAFYPGLQGGEKLISFERNLIELQLQMEDTFIGIAESFSDKAVVVFDQGCMDIKASLPWKMWEKVLQSWGMHEYELLLRYDMVLHMVTAATGAEKSYTATNGKQNKSAEEAKVLDEIIQHAWSDHPNRAIIDNSTGFQEKIRRSLDAVTSYIQELDLALGSKRQTTLGSIFGGFF